jgi:hypothetical protein
MPRLIRFMLSKFTNGAVLGLIFGEALLWADVGRLASLLISSALLTGLFFAQTAVLFGTLGMSVAIMNLDDERR